MGTLPVPHSFLCWVGGKTKLLGDILKYKPTQFNTYHEPFLGSGAVFFGLYRDGLIKRAVLSDINRELIDTYIAVRDHVQDVIRILADFPYSKEFYYELREKDPFKLPLPERAARMIYLNKTAHSCLYRVNRQGKFNAAFGYIRNPAYLNRENLLACSSVLGQVDILCASFESVLERAQPNDWVYFDPPYVPVTFKYNTIRYNTNDFEIKDQERVRDVSLQLTNLGTHVAVSNSNSPVVRTLYSSPVFHIHEIFANRTINAYTDRRGKIRELVITNFPVESTSDVGNVPKQ